MTTAVVVGGGPNGLAAGIHLARNGIDVQVLEAADTIGGGARSGELTVSGVIHDYCSAAHPMGVGSPFWKEIDLARAGIHGLCGYHAAASALRRLRRRTGSPSS
jgi:phytoene dehydrogenase-like protein